MNALKPIVNINSKPMSVHSFVKVLILVMQSGIVAADVHSVVPEDASEQHLDNNDFDDSHQDQAQLAGEQNSPSSDPAESCVLCMHCHCSHFIAINTRSSIEVYPSPENFYYPYQLASVTDFSVSMYRPPKS